MTNQQIIEALVARDEQVTQQFFFCRCKPLFLSIMRYVFSYDVDYDEFVNEFYLYLMENDAYRLRQFQGRSSIYQWLKVIAIRYFVAKRDNMIDMESKDSLLKSVSQKDCAEEATKIATKMDIEYLFSQMSNRRYVYVIRRLVLQEADPKQVAQEIGCSIENLYNIKKRAMAALTALALNEIGEYGI